MRQAPRSSYTLHERAKLNRGVPPWRFATRLVLRVKYLRPRIDAMGLRVGPAPFKGSRAKPFPPNNNKKQLALRCLPPNSEILFLKEKLVPLR